MKQCFTVTKMSVVIIFFYLNGFLFFLVKIGSIQYNITALF